MLFDLCQGAAEVAELEPPGAVTVVPTVVQVTSASC